MHVLDANQLLVWRGSVLCLDTDIYRRGMRDTSDRLVGLQPRDRVTKRTLMTKEESRVAGKALRVRSEQTSKE